MQKPSSFINFYGKKVNVSVGYKKADNAYDSPKINKYISDEIGQWPVYRGKNFSIRYLFHVYYEKDMFWFRLFKNWYGVYGRSLKYKTFKLFSERNGYTRYVKIFGWEFKILKPFKIKSL